MANVVHSNTKDDGKIYEYKWIICICQKKQKTTTFERHSILLLLYLLPKVLDSDWPSYCHDNYADHSCLVSSGGILDEDSCHGSHDMVCDDRFGNCMTDEPNFPP